LVESLGRTSLALSFLAELTGTGKVCAWIDVSNSLNPESAAAVDLDLTRLLWVRCGMPAGTPSQSFVAKGFVLPEKYLIAPPIKRGLHGGGFGQHPRSETKGVARAVSELLSPEAIAPRCAEPQRRVKVERETFQPGPVPLIVNGRKAPVGKEPWTRIEQALRATDLLLQVGGFSAIVLDLGSIAPEHALRVPLNKWHRYRLAAERSQASVLLLTQHACAKSSAGLVLQMLPGKALRDEAIVFTGLEYRVEVLRERFKRKPTNVIPLQNLRREQLELHGTDAPHGQAEDDGVNRVLCLPLREGASGTVHASPSARDASSAVRRDGGRAATGVCLFSEYKGPKTRN
jgi:recombination protein RecA